MTYIIGALIAAYTGFIIYKKIKDFRAGKSCCSGCSSCPSKEKCGQ
ncbi:MAG: FeoB-associated Cys-rich membrane protein [Clostridiales bacterium]|nr:FeoB-associated Cys-rich membrane protein [Clostridiales bacterium]